MNDFLQWLWYRPAVKGTSLRGVAPMKLNSSTVKKLVQSELARGEPFHSWHGVTAQNIQNFLVEPFPVMTSPDDLDTQRRTMWVVLQERAKPTDGYVIVYDPLSGTWNVAEHWKDDYIVTITGPSLAQALDGM